MKYIRKFNESKSEGILVRDNEHLKQLIKESPYNADLNHLDVSKVEDMSNMFYFSRFNGDISGWNVSNVTNMRFMFSESKFNGDISGWVVSNVKYMEDMFKGSPLEGREPIWYTFLWEIGLFPDSKGLQDSIKQYKWLRDNRILKKRLRDSIQAEWGLENDDPQIERILSRLPDKLDGYIIEE